MTRIKDVLPLITIRDGDTFITPIDDEFWHAIYLTGWPNWSGHGLIHYTIKVVYCAELILSSIISYGLEDVYELSDFQLCACLERFWEKLLEEKRISIEAFCFPDGVQYRYNDYSKPGKLTEFYPTRILAMANAIVENTETTESYEDVKVEIRKKIAEIEAATKKINKR